MQELVDEIAVRAMNLDSIK
ncbi:hypothetical protein VCCP1050_3616, partial [Vibrio cholerae CP1050(23)]